MNLFYLADGRNFIHNPETSKEREMKKVFIISLNPVDLKKDKVWTVDAIRALGKGMVDVMQSSGKRASKLAIIEAIIEYQNEQRKADNAVLANISEIWTDGTFKVDRVQELVSSYQGTDLVSQLELYLKGLRYADVTKAKILTTDVVHLLETYYQHHDKQEVIQGLRKVFAAERTAIKVDYNTRRDEALTNKKPIYVSGILTWATDVVSAPTNRSWKELSFALALVTGRRMAELHGEASRFTEATREGYITFEGQLKTKGRDDIEAYEIPVLAPSSQVLEALRVLRDEYKRVLPTVKVNKTFGKSLSTERGVAISKLMKDANLDAYKELRMAYANICWERLADKQKTDIDIYFGSVLGHSTKMSFGGSDKDTPKSYQVCYIAD